MNKENTMNNTQKKETPMTKCGNRDSQTKKHVCNREAGHDGICTDGQIIW